MYIRIDLEHHEVLVIAWADPKRRTGVSGPSLENNNWLWVSLEIIIQISLEEQLDPSGPIARRGRSVRPSVKHVGEQFFDRIPPTLTEFSGSAHEVCYKTIYKLTK